MKNFRTIAAAALVALAIPSGASAAGARITFDHHRQVHEAVQPSPLTLTNATGAPIGGTWQTWVDEARTAVWHGKMVFDSSDRNIDQTCGGNGTDGGCFWENPTELFVSMDRGGRQVLYHEMGHMFDAMALTDADRAEFMRIWRVSIPVGMSIGEAWWLNESMADPMSSGPPGEWFAEGYRLCATYGAWNWQTAFAETWYQYGYPAGNAWNANGRGPAWVLRAQQSTCALINRAALSQS